MFPPFVSAVNRFRAGISAALLFLLTSTSAVYADAAGVESSGTDAVAVRCGDECPPPAETETASADTGVPRCGEECGQAAEVESTGSGADWEEIKRKSREALEAWREGARTAAQATWSATREKSEERWAATEEASDDTLDAVRDRSATALDSTRQGAKQIWEDAAEESKQLWQQAKPKVAEVVVDAAREGGKAWDAAQQAGHTFWQVLTAEDAGESEE